MDKKTASYLSLLIFSMIVYSQSIIAQSSLVDNIRIGASLNYSTLYYESENKMIENLSNSRNSYDFGYQVHAFTSKKLTNHFSFKTGLNFLVFTYNYKNYVDTETSIGISQEINSENGYVLYVSMDGNPSTYYIGLPVFLHIKFPDLAPSI